VGAGSGTAQPPLFKEERMVAGQQLQPTVAPAVWEIYALLPAMIIFMVLAMLFKVVGRLTEPEFLKEVASVAGEVAARKMLPGGR